MGEKYLGATVYITHQFPIEQPYEYPQTRVTIYVQ